MVKTLELTNNITQGLFRLSYSGDTIMRTSYPGESEQLYTIAWNRGWDQYIDIDGERHLCKSQSIITLMANQTFEFEHSQDIVAWQFNRLFYCIVDHDAEVSCVGLLFFGSSDQPFVRLDEVELKKIQTLFQVFIDEFEDKDNLQEDMLRMLLKRLIIKVTRLYKKQNDTLSLPNVEIDTVRHYNLLVNQHYKVWHQVQDYAFEMNKSPKTLSNLFSQFNSKTPLKILHERIILEAKRLLIYTDLSIKEIAFELGFQEVPPFNRLFKKVTATTPSGFREKV